MSGGSPQTTVSQSGPPQVFLDAYGRVVERAEGVSQTPYERYPGQTVAPFSPDQLAAMNIVRQSQGINAPYINQAADYIDQSTGNLLAGVPQMSGQALTGVADQGLGYINQAGDNGILDAVGRLSPDSILPWMSPYTDEVVTATQDDFARSNEQQRQGLVGNAISRGAWGGDRSAVAEGILAGEQQRVQAPVLAGLRDRGYQTGLGAAQNAAALGVQGATADAAARRAAGVDLLGLYTGQQGLGFGANQAQANLAQQAGYGMAGLGREVQSSTLAGAQALSGVGGMQQEQAQRQLNVPYQMFLAEQQYPFQTTGWLSNIASGLGGSAGGTTTSTAPGPSALSQVGGLGLSAAGVIGGTGGFGENGWLTKLFSARGGEIPRRASGGIIDAIPGEYGWTDDPPDLSISIVPGANGLNVKTAGSARGKTPAILQSTGTTTTTEGGGGIGGLLGLAGTAIGSIWGAPGAAAGNAIGRTFGGLFGGANGGGVPREEGGMVPTVTTRQGVRPGSAIPRFSWGMPGAGLGAAASGVAAGADPVAAYLADVMKGASYVSPKTYVPPPKITTPVPDDTAKKEQDPFWWLVANEGGGAGDYGGDYGGGYSGDYGGTGADPAGFGGFDGVDDGGFARGGLIGYAAGGDLPLGIEGEDPADFEDETGILAGRSKPGFMAPGNPWNALIYAGLGTMAGTSSSPLANLGKGALEGLRVYGQDRRSAESTEARRENARLMAKYREQMAETQRRRADAYERKVDADAALAGAREQRTLGLLAGIGGNGSAARVQYDWKEAERVNPDGTVERGYNRLPVRGDGSVEFFPAATGTVMRGQDAATERARIVADARNNATEARARAEAAGLDQRAQETAALAEYRAAGLSLREAQIEVAREREAGRNTRAADAESGRNARANAANALRQQGLSEREAEAVMKEAEKIARASFGRTSLDAAVGQVLAARGRLKPAAAGAARQGSGAPTPEQRSAAIAAAKTAIANGKNRDATIKRLIESGIVPAAGEL